MVNDLLDLARIESGKQPKLEIFDITSTSRTLITFEAHLRAPHGGGRQIPKKQY
jgi:signal transduction histidine kinase